MQRRPITRSHPTVTRTTRHTLDTFTDAKRQRKLTAVAAATTAVAATSAAVAAALAAVAAVAATVSACTERERGSRSEETSRARRVQAWLCARSHPEPLSVKRRPNVALTVAATPAATATEGAEAPAAAATAAAGEAVEAITAAAAGAGAAAGRKVDAQGAAAEVRAVQGVHGRLGGGLVREGDEAEAAAAAGVALHHDARILGAVGAEVLQTSIRGALQGRTHTN